MSLLPNTPALDTLKLTLTQTDGDKTLSVLSLEYPNLSNSVSNVLAMRLVEAIKAEVTAWVTETENGNDPFVG